MGGEENRGGRSHGEELRCGRSQLPSANLESLAQLTHYLTMRLRLVVVVVVVVVEGGGIRYVMATLVLKRYIQWNLRTRDTWGQNFVPCREVVPISEV